MSEDLRVAISVALFLFSGLLSVVTTGAIVMPPRLATALRGRRWRWAPPSLVLASIVSGAVLPWWQSRLLCLAAAALGVAALSTGPRAGTPPASAGRRAAAPSDTRLVLRNALVLASLLVLGGGVATAVAASQP